jgi:LAO/AO transport system kinase
VSRTPPRRAPEAPARTAGTTAAARTTGTALDADTLALLERARTLEKHALARLVSLVERDGTAARARRAALFRHLGAHPERFPARARVVGITGTPGAGKSTLVGRLALRLLERDARTSVAMLAIDPSSVRSGGALLGDRLRTQFPVGERRLFFRSQATGGELGGMGRRTFAVARLLRHLVDLVFIETVGVGQSEIEVSRLADLTVLVLQPLAGDHVQFMKAGVMEVPDVFVINKCDEERLARRSLHELRATLDYARVAAPQATIVRTSAVTGRGIDELTGVVLAAPSRDPDWSDRERVFLERAVADEYGRFGLDALAAARAALPAGASYEDAEAAALAAVRARLRD